MSTEEIKARHERDERHGAAKCGGVIHAKQAHKDRGELLNIVAELEAKLILTQKCVDERDKRIEVLKAALEGFIMSLLSSMKVI
jgi:hypothetical protein